MIANRSGRQPGSRSVPVVAPHRRNLVPATALSSASRGMHHYCRRLVRDRTQAWTTRLRGGALDQTHAMAPSVDVHRLAGLNQGGMRPGGRDPRVSLWHRPQFQYLGAVAGRLGAGELTRRLDGLCGRGEGEEVFFFLGEVQAEDGVQAVEAGEQVGDLVGA
jgi:hypothetical protein